MKLQYPLFIIIALLTTSCVSSKKYKALEGNYMQKSKEIDMLESRYASVNENLRMHQDSIGKLHYHSAIKDEKIQSLNTEISYKKEKLVDIQQQLDRSIKWSNELSKKNEDLIASNKSYADITKNLLETQETLNLKVLNLTLAMEKQDSVNVTLVKKTKREMSDQKYRKALEKLGFVFN